MVPLETKTISPSLQKKYESHHLRFYYNEPEVKVSDFLLCKSSSWFSEFRSYFRVASYKMKRKLPVKERKDGGCHWEHLLKIWGPVKASRHCHVLQHSAWVKMSWVVLSSWAAFDRNGEQKQQPSPWRQIWTWKFWMWEIWGYKCWLWNITLLRILFRQYLKSNLKLLFICSLGEMESTSRKANRKIFYTHFF